MTLRSDLEKHVDRCDRCKTKFRDLDFVFGWQSIEQILYLVKKLECSLQGVPLPEGTFADLGYIKIYAQYLRRKHGKPCEHFWTNGE